MHHLIKRNPDLLKAILVIFSILIFLQGFSQSEISFHFELENQHEEFQVNQLRYYMSSVKLIDNNEITYQESSSYHLIDHDDPSSLALPLRIPEGTSFDAIAFTIGVDSTKNMQGVHGGDLDPTKGMYWTWQSGYINFKLEAEMNSKELSYHIGGFMHPNNASRSVIIPLQEKQEKYTIQVSPFKIIESLDYQKVNHVMSPGKSANFIADILPTLFSLK